jgi:hypothetical protein
VALAWRAHPSVAAVRSVRVFGPRGWDGTEVPGGATGLTDRPLEPGEYAYLVRCGYRDPVGGLVWSPGEWVTATAVVWPAPVTEVGARPEGPGGRVRLTWTPPARGESRLVVWRARPPAPGSDLSAALGRLSAVQGDGTGHAVTVLPPLRGALRLMAVSVLGARAVAGPSVLLERAGPVEALEVRRLAPGRAEVSFRWPEPAVLVLLTWEGDGRRAELRIARSRHRAGRIEIPVGPGPQTVTVAPVARPDAALAFHAPARAGLPGLPLPRLVLHRAGLALGPVRRAVGPVRRAFGPVRRAVGRLARRR